MMEYLPREDGFPLGFALGKTILPRETFHHGIPSGMSYLYNVTPTGMAYLFYYTEQTPFVI